MIYHDLDPLLASMRWTPPDRSHSGPLKTSLDLVEVLGKSGLAVLPKRPAAGIIRAVAKQTGLSEKDVRAVYKALVEIGS